MWILWACLSALFAGLTSVLAKCGIRKTDSDVATALRTGVVFIFAWMMAFVSGSVSSLGKTDGNTFVFLVLSGLATGASWICYFKALSVGEVNKVAAVDKSSTVLTVIFAVLILGETEHLLFRLFCIVLIGGGTLLMIEKGAAFQGESRKSWLFYAGLSAVFAALTSILSKIGIDGIESNLGTAVRTSVVLPLAWLLVFIKGKGPQIRQIATKELWFIVLSGIATGGSWLCYYRAIQEGIVSIVVPIDKLSILVTVAFSCLFLKERLTKKSILGLLFITGGTLLMAVSG